MTAYSLLHTRVNELQQAQKYDIDFERIVTKLEELYEQIKPLIDIYKTKSPSKQAAKIWEERYYMTYADGKRDESLEDAIRRIARSIAAADVKYAKNAQQLHRLEKIYFDIFSARLMLLNSPALFNLGVGVPKEPYFTKESPTLEDYQYIFDNMDRRKTLHACYPMDIDDDLKAIFNALKDAALISSAGGGIGINFSKLRPQYSRINTAGFSSGSVSFMQLFDTMGAIILQGGKRRFAGMATHGFADWQITDFWNAPVSFHPDIISFIHSKEHNTGESMLSRFNISVGINNSKDFLKAIDENRAVPLSFMGKRMSEIVFDAHKDKVADSISASDLFYDIVTLAWKTGDPGLIFWDKINKFNPIRELVPMVSVNPCVTGDTRILTPEGFIQAEELFEKAKREGKPGVVSQTIQAEGGEQVGYPVKVILPGDVGSEHETTPKIVDGYIWKIGRKKVFKVITEEGYEIAATGDHRLQTPDGWKYVNDLKPGDEMLLAPIKVNDNFGLETIGVDIAFMLGEVIGKELAQSSSTDDKQIPNIVYKLNLNEIAMFLKSLFIAGEAINNDKAIYLIAKEKKRLQQVQELLLLFGIKSTIHERTLEDTTINYELVISGYSRKLFKDYIGFEGKKNEKLTLAKTKIDHPVVIVKEVQKLGEEIVYDLTVPGEHRYIGNGFINHNCGEKPAISSYKYRIITPCDLGSIDVYKFTTTKDVMWRELLAISQIGAYILDVLHELMMHPTPAIKKGVLLFRDIGLGFFGLAGALIKLFIPYDSPQGRAIAYGIMKAIEVGATRMSRFLGSIKGTYLMAPYVDKSIYVAQVWHKDHKQYENILRMYSAKYQDVVKLYEEEKAIMQEYGNSIYRNFVRTSVAPTGTISILAQTDEDEDVGSGIEPIYAYKYKRYVVSKDNQTKDIVTYKTKLLRYTRNADISILESWLDEHDNFEGISKVYPELEDVERVFASAHTIAPDDHLYMLEAVQWACSNGVSKTINLKREATIDDVAHIYRLALASPVIKGITIYRDGSLDTQVLVSESKDKKESAPSFIVQDIKLNTVSIDKEDDSTWQRHAKGFLIHPETGQAVCPVCHSEIIFKEGCISCSNSDCGWSACS